MYDLTTQDIQKAKKFFNISTDEIISFLACTEEEFIEMEQEPELNFQLCCKFIDLLQRYQTLQSTDNEYEQFTVKSTEQHLSDYFKSLIDADLQEEEAYLKGAQDGVLKTLEIFNVKIKGINK